MKCSLSSQSLNTISVSCLETWLNQESSAAEVAELLLLSLRLPAFALWKQGCMEKEFAIFVIIHSNENVSEFFLSYSVT